MAIYPLLKTAKGLVPSEFAVAEVALTDNRVQISCGDGALREKLREIFSRPVTVTRACGEMPRLFSHSYLELKPGTEDFFREMIFELRHHNLYGDLVAR